jgi:hypothetical protein
MSQWRGSSCAESLLAVPCVEGAIGEFINGGGSVRVEERLEEVVDGGSVLMGDWRVHWSGEGWCEF